MLNLTYDEKKHLDKWDIDVKPYLTLEEMGSIINQMTMKHTGLERDMCLIANVLVACTDLYTDNEDAKYTYEDILYSGLWKDLMESCPILMDNIAIIKREVGEFFSLNKKKLELINTINDKLESFDLNKAVEVLEKIDSMEDLKDTIIEKTKGN